SGRQPATARAEVTGKHLAGRTEQGLKYFASCRVPESRTVRGHGQKDVTFRVKGDKVNTLWVSQFLVRMDRRACARVPKLGLAASAVLSPRARQNEPTVRTVGNGPHGMGVRQGWLDWLT